MAFQKISLVAKKVASEESRIPAILLAVVLVGGFWVVMYLAFTSMKDAPPEPVQPEQPVQLPQPATPSVAPPSATPSATMAPPADLRPPVVVAPPTFDVVRVSKDGTMVVAGRASPGTVVNILANGNIIAVANADTRGEWVVIVPKPLKPGNFEITLQSSPPSDASSQVVLISVPQKENTTPLVVMAQKGKATRVLQGEGVISPDGSLFFESVEYDVEGNMIFSGYGEVGANVRVYLDERFMGEARIAKDGRWIVIAPEIVPEGVYVARVDLINVAGAVVARVNAPFEKVIPTTLGSEVSIVPGDNLWTIARKVYGSGWRYTVIFEANANKIRDPDLIYPGQVFTLPQLP